MADWYGHARSNYFRVKDQDAFADLCEKWNVTFIIDKDNPELVGFICETDSGSLPNYRCEEHEDLEGNIQEFDYDFDDFLEKLSLHLEEGEIAIMIECGAEKLRYITGVAYAINSKGETVIVSLNDIYEKAKLLGNNITLAEY